MISSRRLAQLARRWLTAAAARRKRIPFRKWGSTNAAMAPGSDSASDAPLAGKGRFVVYSSDGQRFEVPLAYLKSDIFRELFRMSEDVFGLPSARLITLPCDAGFMDSVVCSLQKRRPSRDAEKALLASMAARPCSALFDSHSCPPQANEQLLVSVC